MLFNDELMTLLNTDEVLVPTVTRMFTYTMTMISEVKQVIKYKIFNTRLINHIT